MTEKTAWEEFFDGHAPAYMENSFTANTVGEVEFAIDELGVEPGARILDIGCGTGRHAIELARRGFSVTGVDLSAGMLSQARQHAVAAGVDVTWVQANAAEVEIAGVFDAAICLCEGAFGLLSAGDDPVRQPLAILDGIARSLRPGARCLFTVLNGFAIVRRHTQADVTSGAFDPLTLSEVSECSPGGAASSRVMRERGFVPTELVLLFRQAGLTVRHVWGGTAGNWQRGPLDLDEIEMMVVGELERDGAL